MKLKIFFFYLLLLWIHCKIYAQGYELVNVFTTENGLPSNQVYDFVQDDEGSLWIGTDNSVSRFDGKFFNNYGIKKGLPSNDAIEVLKENNGRIWVNSFKQTPSYFDPIHNKFVGFSDNEIVAKISTTLLRLYTIQSGGIGFVSSRGFFKIKGKSIVQYFYQENSKFYEAFQGIHLDWKPNSLNKSFIKYIHEDNTLEFYRKAISPKNTKFARNTILYGFNNSLYLFHSFTKEPFAYQETKCNLSSPIKMIKVCGDKAIAITNTNIIYIIDLKTIQVTDSIATTYTVNNAYLDRDFNLWVGTLRNGILLYKKNAIVRHFEDIPHNDFLSIASSPDRKLYAGTFFGSVHLLSNNNRNNPTPIINFKNEDRYINTIFSGNEPIFISVNYFLYKGKKITLYGKEKSPIRIISAIAIDHQHILLGTIDGLFLYELSSGHYEKIGFTGERVMFLSYKDANSCYIVTGNGLFFYNINNKNYETLSTEKNLTFLTLAQDWLFAANLLGEIIVYHKNKYHSTIPNDIGLPENILHILYQNNKIYLSSKSGLCILDIDLHKKNIVTKVTTLTESDGLLSNLINRTVYHDSNIYLATSKGISQLPKDFTFTIPKVNPIIISLKINEKEQPLQDAYSLSSQQRSINILFSGIELTGHFKNIQYRLNTEQVWNNLQNNNLNILLNYGKNILEYRAIDNNNNPSEKIKRIVFEVATPLTNTIWFWLIVGGIILTAIFYAIGRWRYLKQKEFFRHKLDLERQRSKITADLHDDLGATLSSLQINSMIAGRKLKDNPEEAQKILYKIELQSQKISENIGDIIWSLKPSEEQFMSLSTRIVTFANEILGSTDIIYTFDIDESVNTLITEFSQRKNIILIAKEAINNIAKYSQATQVKITLSHKGDDIILLIKDNGLGFDTNITKGNGIGNMTRRATEIDGHILIDSSAQGTTVMLTIPIFREQ